LPVIVDRADRRPDSMSIADGSVYVREGRCPYPECGAAVFASAFDRDDCLVGDPHDGMGGDPDRPNREPIILFSAKAARWVRLRHAVEAVAPLLFAWSMTFGILAVALWAAVRGLADEESGLAIGLVLGGPAMVVVSICTFVAMAMACGGRGSRGQVTLDLALRPVPRSYRTV
jgi:hypothetical protein